MKKRMGEGFDYAYRYPGMNKVLQAAGRVIRTIDDVGVIELLDERFLQSDYRNLFPKEWEKRLVCTVDSVESYLEKFWEEKTINLKGHISIRFRKTAWILICPFVLFQTELLWCLSGSRPCRTMQWYQDRNVHRWLVRYD